MKVGVDLWEDTLWASDIIRRLLSASAAKTATTTGHVLPYPSLVRHSRQSLHMHRTSLNFGKEWAQMSAVFGASRVLVQTLRRQEDEWNTVLGSALAGAVFASRQQARRLPPVAMGRGALLYGGTMLLLNPTLMLTTPTSENAVPSWDYGIQ